MATTLTQGMQQFLLDPMVHVLNGEMLKAAEPIIKKAMAEIEKEMRAEMAYRLISTIQSNMRIETHGTDVVVTIRQAKENVR